MLFWSTLNKNLPYCTFTACCGWKWISKPSCSRFTAAACYWPGECWQRWCFSVLEGGEQRDSIKAQDLQHHWTGAVQKRSLIHTDGVQNKGDIKKKTFWNIHFLFLNKQTKKSTTKLHHELRFLLLHPPPLGQLQRLPNHHQILRVFISLPFFTSSSIW